MGLFWSNSKNYRDSKSLQQIFRKRLIFYDLNSMNTNQDQQNHFPSSFQHHLNHHHQKYRCYIRTPDMKSNILNVQSSQSVDSLKQQIKSLLNLSQVAQPSSIRLIVNEVELTNQMNLSLHLFQNAIIHVLVPSQKTQEQIINTEVTIQIKQPPIDCPAYSIQNVSLYLTIRRLKERIISFYRIQHSQNQIASLKQNDLFLVYAGRIMTDDKVLWDYHFDGSGVVYVVNGKIYAKQVTKEEAEKRFQQIKNKNSAGQPTEQLQAQQSNALCADSKNIVFNIIQNIVHDQDSDIEGETADDLARSQKIIHRYDSMNRDIQSLSHSDAITEQNEFLASISEPSNKIEGVSDSNVQEQLKDQSGQFKEGIQSYLKDLNSKIINIEQSNQESEYVHQTLHPQQSWQNRSPANNQNQVNYLQSNAEEQLLD